MNFLRAFSLHAALGEKSLLYCVHLQNEVNSDEAQIFQNKKYKDLMAVAQEQVNDTVDHLTETYNLNSLLSELKELSKTRLSVQGLPVEEKQDLFEQYAYELTTVFEKNYSPEEAPTEEDPKAKKKKKAGGKAWGKGVKVLMDFLGENKKEGKSTMINFF